MPKLSVCIPAYNAAPYIEETVGRILSSDYPDLEVFISDDASTDDTASRIEAIRDKRIRFVQQEKNLGLAGNWNYLYDNADCDYFLLVCSDDVIMPEALSKKAKVLDENPDVNIVFSSSYVIGSSGKRIMTRRPYKSDRRLDGKELSGELFCTKNFMAEPPNNMMRASAMREAGRFDDKLWYNIDVDYWLRILQTGNAYYIDEPLSAFRISKTSVTGSSLTGRAKIMADEAVFMEKYRSGAIMPVTDEMLKARKKKLDRRLLERILFMKALRIIYR